MLYPPVRMHDGGHKEPIILSVGRFFGAESGHSKKQLQLVEAFRRLLDRGVAGWTLHLVGGCGEADLGYLESVQAAAEGLPVVFHVDAPGDELEDLYARASLFWHATGLGEDPEADPQRLEHFGIATVEAMSAGVVPVVFGVAGQLEIVEDGVSGYHFDDLDELVDPDHRAGRGSGASVRSVPRRRRTSPGVLARPVRRASHGLAGEGLRAERQGRSRLHRPPPTRSPPSGADALPREEHVVRDEAAPGGLVGRGDGREVGLR